MAREVGRHCTKCGHDWFDVPKSYTPAGSFIAGTRQRRQEYVAFKHCPRCNSTKIDTVKGRALKKFVPTAAKQPLDLS